MTDDRRAPLAPEEALAWIRSSLERSAAKMRADGFPGAVVQIETLLKCLPDTPNPPEHV